MWTRVFKTTLNMQTPETVVDTIRGKMYSETQGLVDAFIKILKFPNSENMAYLKEMVGTVTFADVDQHEFWKLVRPWLMLISTNPPQYDDLIMDHVSKFSPRDFETQFIPRLIQQVEKIIAKHEQEFELIANLQRLHPWERKVGKWECAICFDWNSTRHIIALCVQDGHIHAACDECYEKMSNKTKCHICRRPTTKRPLAEVPYHDKTMLGARMSFNPYVTNLKLNLRGRDRL